MLHQPEFTQAKPRSYEQIGHRVKEIISDPKVQKVQFVTVSRLPNEGASEWRRLMIEIASTQGIRVEKLDKDSFKIGWREYCEA
jgi:hypothetical protein